MRAMLRDRRKLQAEVRQADGRCSFSWGPSGKGGRPVVVETHFDAEPDRGLRTNIEAAGWSILVNPNRRNRNG